MAPGKKTAQRPPNELSLAKKIVKHRKRRPHFETELKKVKGRLESLPADRVKLCKQQADIEKAIAACGVDKVSKAGQVLAAQEKLEEYKLAAAQMDIEAKLSRNSRSASRAETRFAYVQGVINKLNEEAAELKKKEALCNSYYLSEIIDVLCKEGDDSDDE